MKNYLQPTVEIIVVNPVSVFCGSPDDLKKYDRQGDGQMGNVNFFDEGEDNPSSNSNLWND